MKGLFSESLQYINCNKYNHFHLDKNTSIQYLIFNYKSIISYSKR